MAAYFKKRRKNDGPNKNEQKVLRGKRRSASGDSLGDLFPALERLSLSAAFYSHSKDLLDQRDLSWGPGDECDLTLACIGRCGSGVFDISEKVRQVVAAGLTEAAASGACAETLYAGLPDTCGCELRCSLKLAYAPSAVPQKPAQ